MVNFKLLPLIGVECDKKSILLGDDFNKVISVLGKPESDSDEDVYYYFNSNVQVFFNQNGLVEFIQFAYNEHIDVIIDKINVFKESFDKLFDILSSKNGKMPEDNENGYSYYFHEISVGVTRDATPESVEEILSEMNVDSDIMVEDVEDEKFKSTHLSSIGLGEKNYYDN